jgi:hypothetical protein
MTIAHSLAYNDTAAITAVKNYRTGLVSNLYNFVTETNEKKLVLSSSRFLQPIRVGFNLTH